MRQEACLQKSLSKFELAAAPGGGCAQGILARWCWKWGSPGAGCAHSGRRGKGRAASHCSLVAWSLHGSKYQVCLKPKYIFFCLIKASALAAKRWAEYLPRPSQATESWERWDWKSFLCQPGPAGRSPVWQVMSTASWCYDENGLRLKWNESTAVDGVATLCDWSSARCQCSSRRKCQNPCMTRCNRILLHIMGDWTTSSGPVMVLLIDIDCIGIDNVLTNLLVGSISWQQKPRCHFPTMWVAYPCCWSNLDDMSQDTVGQV